MSKVHENPVADISALIVSIARRIHDCESRIADAVQLSSLEIQVLRDIQLHPGTTSGSIGLRLGLKSSNTSAALRTLTERDLVLRETDTIDRRTVRVKLTAKALENISLVRKRTSQYLQPYILDTDIENLRAALSTIESAMEASPQTGMPPIA